MIDQANLSATMDLARTLAWISNAVGRWLDREKAIAFVRDLSAPGSEAMLFTAALRISDLDPGEIEGEPIEIGGEKFIPVRKRQANQHWDKAWRELQNAARCSEISVCGRPQGRRDAHMELIPAMEFGQLVLMQGDDGGSRLASLAAREQFWDKVETLTVDVLRLWPIDVDSDVPELPLAPVATSRRRGPKPDIRLAVEQAMRDAVREGFDLESEKEEALAERFGASRATCRAARNNVLAGANSDKHRQTPPNDK